MANKLKNLCSYLADNKYQVYVLTMCMLVYLVNQLNTFCLIATNKNMAQEIKYGDRECEPTNQTSVETYLREVVGSNNTAFQFCQDQSARCEAPVTGWNISLCYWHYLGSGIQYQLLAGPLYIVLFSISGIPMGLISELNNINRKLILVVCAVLWSAMTVAGGFSRQYWHLALTRILMGIFSAGCVPFCASIISDYFPTESRGAAMGFYNWGVYVGFSITYALLAAERTLGWRVVYYIAGAPGILLGIIVLITVRDPARGATEVAAEKALDKLANTCSKLRAAALCFLDPALLLLCLGGAIRNGAGISWAYNNVAFFNEYHPGTRMERWMTWIPLVFGSFAAITGGIISDKLSATRGTTGRLMVLIVSIVISGPFMVGTLYAPTEVGAFLCHIPGYVFGEMWIGVCVAVVLDLVPADLRTSSVAVYFFIIQIIGGNMPLLIPPIRRALDLRRALLICYPGFYWVGALFFVFCLLVVTCRATPPGGGSGAANKSAVIAEVVIDNEQLEKKLGAEAAAGTPAHEKPSSIMHAKLQSELGPEHPTASDAQLGYTNAAAVGFNTHM